MHNVQKYRMTSQRRVIIDELRKVYSHPTADEIYMMVRKILPNISLGTVYRNLEILSETGVIRKLSVGVSQKRFDGNPTDHYHIICTKCKRMNDVPSNTVSSFKYLPESIEGFDKIEHILSFVGLCEKCQ